MSIADDSMALRAKSLIERWGGPAQLLRGGVLRDCTAAVLSYNPRAEKLNLAEAERVYIAGPLDVPPDHEQDVFIKGGKKYSIVSPVKGPRPNDTPIFFDLDVLYVSAYP
jgi:hypothetical protein